MDFTRLTKRAKDVIDQRGGMKSVVDDAKELKDIAQRRDGSAGDKLKEAASALRTPGADPAAPAAGAAPESAPAPAPEAAPAPAPEAAPAPAPEASPVREAPRPAPEPPVT